MFVSHGNKSEFTRFLSITFQFMEELNLEMMEVSKYMVR